MQTTGHLTELQQDILKICSVDINENELKEIRDMLAQYFAKKAMDEADKIWDQKGYSNELMDEWINDPKQ